MNYDLDTELLKSDLRAIGDFFTNFAKSFGPSPRKISFLEETKIRFMLTLVEMGPVKIFKTVVVIIGGIVLYFTMFRHSDSLFMMVTVVLFIMFYAWVWKPELAKEAKDGKSGFDHHFVSISEGVQSVFKKK